MHPKYDIALLPEESIASRAIEYSEHLKSLGTEFVLGRKTNLPHLSMYMFRLKDEDMPKVVDIVEATAHKAIHLKAVNYGFNWQYFDVEYARTKELEELQAKILDITKYRQELDEGDRKLMEEAAGEAKRNWKDYGFKQVGELYRPHLTFTRFKTLEEAPSDPPNLEVFSGKYIRLGIYQLGPHGTCLSEVAGFDLS